VANAPLEMTLKLLTRSWRAGATLFLTIALVSAAVGVCVSLTYSLLVRPLPSSRANAAAVLSFAQLEPDVSRRFTPLPLIRDLHADYMAAPWPGVTAIGAGWQMVVSIDTGDRRAEVLSEAVYGDYFDVLGFAPRWGRLPTRGASEVVLRADLATQMYGSAESGLDQQLTIEGATFAVVGVLDTGTSGWRRARLWMAAAESNPILPREPLREPAFEVFETLVSLEHTRSLDHLRAVWQTTAPRLRAGYPELGEYTDRPDAAWLRDVAIGRTARRVGHAAVGAAVLLLLVGLANVTLITKTHAAASRRVLAVVAAVGGRRVHQVRYVFGPLLVLAPGAAAAGAVLAGGMRARYEPLLHASTFPNADGGPLTLVLAVSMAALVLAAATAAVALRATRAIEPGDELVRSAGAVPGWRTTEGWVAVGLQIGATVWAVAITAALLTHLTTLMQTELGYTPEGLYETVLMPEERLAVAAEAQNAWAARDAVAVALSSRPVFAERRGGVSIDVPGRGLILNSTMSSPPIVEYVSANYFDVLGTAVLVGGRDLQRSPFAAVVNARMAQAFWGRTDVLGERFTVPALGPEPLTVVGVVEDVRYGSPRNSRLPVIYVPFDIRRDAKVSLIVRDGASRHAAATLALWVPSLREPALRLRYIEAALSAELLPERTMARMGTALAALGVLLGVFAAVALMDAFIASRRRALAIRMSFGATTARLAAHAISHMGLVVLGATCLGALAALQTMALGHSYLADVPGRLTAAQLAWTLGVPLAVLVAAFSRLAALRALNIVQELKSP
jgi:hypothetical protein